MEWVAIAFGSGGWLLAIFGYTIADMTQITPGERVWFFSVLILAMGLLVVFRTLSRRAIAVGLAMHHRDVTTNEAAALTT